MINQQIASFDDFVDKFGELCNTVHRGLFTDEFGRWDRGPMSQTSCVIGGWSDARQAYEAYRVVSYEKKSVDAHGQPIRLKPFTAVPLPADALWCNYSPRNLEEFGLASELPNEDLIDVASRYICAARADSGVGEDNDAEGESRYFMAGGFIQICVVQNGQTQSWIAHRWAEDQIGKPIDPTGPERFPEALRERYEQAKAEAEPTS